MEIECLTQREGYTPVMLEEFKYMFQPIPTYFRRKDGTQQRVKVTTSHCDVQNEDHIKYLLKRANFRPMEYPDGIRYIDEDPEDRRFVGFTIEKCGESGYMIADKRAKVPQYCGSDAQWRERPTGSGLVPFPSMTAANQHLTELADMEGFPERTDAKKQGK
jgi:hypothetical protein